LRDKRKKFVDIAERRVNRLINEIRLVGNLSNRSNYEYKEEDVRRIFAAVDSELRNARRRFESTSTAENSSFKL
jgi:hypothetical protein